MMEFRQVMKALPEKMVFGVWPIAREEIFYASKLSFAFTNLKPVIPGHVLVAPNRSVPRLSDLSAEEVADLFVTAEFVGRVMTAEHPESDALTFNVQDGKSAGQTVPHVHVHVIPRNPNDLFNAKKNNDAIYEAINEADRESAKLRVDQPDEIKPRVRAELVKEAQKLLTTVERVLSS